ncbi:NAD(P)-dependent dehydrogenase, short-chain alcohol dehydrogenase family [Marinactinospora thermotolerans DSM 45154]|uniref:NAD(P)-dependent dehydrogenase, short-chain alcohol dehydrogenase family n=2 Tax=Marinactinospora thermotolerans TaxID=531310 RepID=A0A1T4T4F0_9ACTN|nr:NAD(P)-dependent dehydrogenase, short-chain alcohol dehydrogenase family [Marinactinospora thermotolerans DSM 45154]
MDRDGHEETGVCGMTQPDAQSQPYPGRTGPMTPEPRDEMRDYEGRGLLSGKKALISGGDSGIGRAVAIAFAKEGADVAIAYLEEHEDARRTAELVEQAGARCLPIPGDLGDEAHCADVVARAVAEFGGLDIVVAHHGTQAPVEDFAKLSTQQLTRTYQVNVFGVFWLLREAVPHLPEGGSVIITGSVNGLRGNKSLIDYATSKAAVMNLTYCLAQHYTDKGIRFNCVAPGPVWTPLIPATLPEEKVEGFGQQAPMGRAADPDEIAPSYVFFASGRLSSYYTGEVLAPIGGEIQSS